MIAISVLVLHCLGSSTDVICVTFNMINLFYITKTLWNMTPNGSVPENESLYACVAISLPWIIIFKISHQLQVLWDFFHQGHSKWPQTFEQYFQIEFVNICRFISFYLFHYSPVCSQRRLRLQKMSLFSLSLKWYLKVVLWWQKCWFNETNLEFFEIDHLVVRTKKNRLEWIEVCLDSVYLKLYYFNLALLFICVLLLRIVVLYYFLYSVNKVIYSIFFFFF